ncbi:TPA: acylneuraminate cytidylyltransferase family protein [Escherichia coli]|nr:acylneuraminate cytidylyltransferase family protein [Escherichia coli]HBB0016150.1 acylneuraminate cytidylyltransferase family protein [Escherichia coli]
MKNYAFIFARGGSKGLPGKNIKELCGKPLLHYAIEIAQLSPSIDKVFVSTDDADIKQKALELKDVVVIDRPDELSGDKSPEWFAWRHAIEWVTEHYGAFGQFVSLPATSPLREVQDVERAIAKRMQTDADICIAVTPASRSPYFNMVKINSNGLNELVISPEGDVSRRQNCPDVFDITTVVYVSTPEFILNNIGLFSGNVTSVEVPKERAVDIDDIYDFLMAETILMMKKECN